MMSSGTSELVFGSMRKSTLALQASSMFTLASGSRNDAEHRPAVRDLAVLAVGHAVARGHSSVSVELGTG